MTQAEHQKDTISRLLLQAGLNNGAFEVSSAESGGNNRVWIIAAAGNRYVVKWYVPGLEGSRDRMGAEWAFLQYAKARNIGCVPRPLACDPAHNVALHSVVEGKRLTPGDIGDDGVDQAAEFLCALNRDEAGQPVHLMKPELPVASEAAFSVAAHFTILDGRIARLEHINETDEATIAARRLVVDLKRDWDEIRQKICDSLDGIGVSLTEELSPEERCISPSDFGFHNALLSDNGDYAFIDFEYAGWDDPAKVVGDFFFQPAVPVPAQYYERFADKVLAIVPNVEAARKRADILCPLFGLKWVCIMLNVFIPQWIDKRPMMTSTENLETIRYRQLNKAVQALNNLHSIVE